MNNSTTGGEPAQLIINSPEPFDHMITTAGYGCFPSAEQKPQRKRKPWVYKSDYDKIKKERDARRAFMISIGIIAGLVLTQIFGRQIIDLILSV